MTPTTYFVDCPILKGVQEINDTRGEPCVQIRNASWETTCGSPLLGLREVHGLRGWVRV